MATLNNDIERYIRGELTPAEMNALEQKALQDPFLAEALEGAEHAGAEHFSVDIELLKHAIKTKARIKRLPKTITLNGWGMYAGIAAGLVLLAVSTYVIFLSIDNKRSKGIAQMEQSIDKKNKMPGNTDQERTDSLLAMNTPPVIPEKTAGDVVEEKKAANENIRKHTREILSKPKQAASEESAQPASTTETFALRDEEEESLGPVAKTEMPVNEKKYFINADTITAMELSQVEVNGFTIESKRSVTGAITELQGKVSGVQISNENHLVRGRVTSGGEPLPGVNVTVKGSNHGTVTDAYGNFLISTPPGKQTIQVAFIGYATEEVLIGSDDHVNVDLKPDMKQLSEVVVTGYSTTASSDEYEDEFEMAAPEEGRKAFNEYLKNQLQYPQAAIENKIEGKVTVQFFVETNGQLTDFKVVKGIGYGCDEELIRLIKQGPKWTPSLKNGISVRERVKVRLRFVLPK